MEKKKNNWVGKIVVIILIIVSIGSYYVFPSVKHVMNQVFKMFASGDFTVVRDFVASYGAYAAISIRSEEPGSPARRIGSRFPGLIC